MEAQEVLTSKDEHFALFSKPKLAPMGSENSGQYKKFVPLTRDICFMTEFFVFEEMKRRGFTSKYLTVNPYENDFNQFLDSCAERDKGLPESVARSRLLAELETYHKKALASIK